MARLIPQRNCFGFVEQIAEPVEQTPRRVKKTPFNPDSSEKKSEHGHKGEKEENSLESPENLEINQGETGPLPAEKLDGLDTDNGDRQLSSGATSLTEEPSNGSTEAVVELEPSLEPELPKEPEAKKRLPRLKQKLRKPPRPLKLLRPKLGAKHLHRKSRCCYSFGSGKTGIGCSINFGDLQSQGLPAWLNGGDKTVLRPTTAIAKIRIEAAIA
ncbi:hypothetical protein NON20_06810 [Synechocystis sp. B12]|nr:hypothetical protein NON20_06810 [Synechocystis sp. B12]